ncbi:hypothetical protein SPI_01833 [Niveomyces insectorum RCEF 264]|uniref:Uncharacterized protein n=1 Tax=Niveomyces insectorum RCEF 264 TaxID=1081102 RepID=A0A167Z9W1_9HYPO|nr:hypothetical protein SPI_01833 [Niveomyces insectorum RCEF 264]
MSGISLPTAEAHWTRLIRAHNLETVSIHDGQYKKSASEATFQQYLLLRILAYEVKGPDDFVDAEWVDADSLKRAKNHLRASATITQFDQFLLAILDRKTRKSHANQFRSLGAFALARQYQIALTDVVELPVSNARPKLEFTPKTRAGKLLQQQQASMAAAGAGPSTPKTPTPSYSYGARAREDSVDDLNLDDIQLSESDLSSSFGSSNDPDNTMRTDELSPFATLDRELALLVPSVPDEQIVNVALLAFLDALNIHCLDVHGDWSSHRGRFVFQRPQGPKIYEARVDGYLRRAADDSIRAIVEVKPFLRNAFKSQQIQLQEGSQMAAWICHYPPEELEACRAKGTRMKRLLISQDSDEIFLNFAVFYAEYVDFVRGVRVPDTATRQQGNDGGRGKGAANIKGKAPRGIKGQGGGEDRTFLRIHEYGPFSVFKRNHVKMLGEYLLAFCIAECGR